MRTLVLNRGLFPIAHVGWKKAFRLLCRGRAEVVETYEEIVKTPNDFYFIPAVIKLTSYNSLPKVKVSYSKRSVLERDNFKCQYCCKKLGFSNATIDHVLPRAAGGKTTFENTVAACFTCNNKKGNKMLGQTKLSLFKKPIKPKYQAYKILLGPRINKEWTGYLPRGMLNGVQIND